MQITHFSDGIEITNGKIDEQAMLNGKDDHVAVNSEERFIFEKSLSSSSSTSSAHSSEGGGEEEFIQFDATELGKPFTGNEQILRSISKLPPDVGEDAQSLTDIHTRDNEMGGRNTFSHELAGNPDESSSLRSKQAPPTQVMVRSDAPNPCRIPSSIFERSKSKTPVEWSVASNESLFSIHEGNSSFSGDHVFFLGRSGELSDVYMSPTEAYSPKPKLSGPQAKDLHMGNDLGQDAMTEAANAEAMNDVLKASAEGHVDKEKPPADSVRHSASTSRHSDASNQSFAFPILTHGQSGSVKVQPLQMPQPQTQQQVKAEDHKDAPEAPLDSTQGSWCSCCFCCVSERGSTTL